MRTLVAVPAALALLSAGCDLGEVTVAAPEAVVVAEVYLRWAEDAGDARALIHRSVGHASEPIEGARVRMRDEHGREEVFEEVDRAYCLARAPADFREGCYRLPRAAREMVRPEGRYEVTVELPSGERLEGHTRMPGDFSLVKPTVVEGSCGLPPDTGMRLAWTPASGAWAYLPEASIGGLRDVLAPQGIDVRTDPVVLVGLAVSEADTTIAFPSEFGVFNRFSGDGDLLLALRDGLPDGVGGRIVVSAIDRNATNWSRGGAFNPSGWVRIPSLFGDGTGVVASAVVRGFDFEVDPDGHRPPCVPSEGGP
jgi:hypothetical protein